MAIPSTSATTKVALVVVTLRGRRISPLKATVVERAWSACPSGEIETSRLPVTEPLA
jgi:hypothetical protein